jgi:hypothetical protein
MGRKTPVAWVVESEGVRRPLVHSKNLANHLRSRPAIEPYRPAIERLMAGRCARYLSKRRIKGVEIGRRSNLRIEGAGIGRRMTFTQIFPRRIWLGPQMGRRWILSTQVFPRRT